MSSADHSDKKSGKNIERAIWITSIIVTGFGMFAFGYDLSFNQDSKLITDLNKQVVESHKFIDMINKANDQYYNDTSSLIEAIRLAEMDNFTMQNQISPHCFWKMTGNDSSLERCYKTNDVDERVKACMTGHDFMAFQTHRIGLQESYNRDLCTKEVKGQR